MSNTVTYELVDGIGVITIDYPPVNAASHAVRQGIQDGIRAAQADASRAVIIICAGRTFVAGADITEFGKPPKEPWLPELCNEIEASAKPVIAAIHGTALGGGLEIAIAAHYRCALDSAQFGLPEVKLGLLPGAGGTQRTPRLAGVEAALAMISSGTPVDANTALNQGLIDEIVSGDLREQAMAFAQRIAADRAPIRRTRELPVEHTDPSIFGNYRKTLARKARGQEAPLRIVDCIEATTMMTFPEGLAKERELFLECMASPQSAAMRHVFFAEREAAKVEGIARNTARRDVRTVGVIGAGTMGAGIAMAFANAGFEVQLLEINDDALGRGLENIARQYVGGIKRGKLTEAEAKHRRDLIVGTTSYDSLANVDLVIEAVFEDLSLKQDIFGTLDGVCKQGAILATNTSYQDVDRIAAATRRPQDVLGLHFFSPANIMKLLEVVRGEATADDVLATCLSLAKRIGKVPVVAGVCYGFIGNRMLQHYGREAQLCLIEGATPETIDTSMQQWGMAMGPMRVFDLAGLDVGYKARQGLPVEERGDPRAYRIPDALVEMGRLGQKSGSGIYTYDPETRAPTFDDESRAVIEREAAAMGIERQDIEPAEIVDRLIYALVNEGLNIVDEGIAQRPGDVDVVYVYGYGFPVFRGGPLHYAETVGYDTVYRRICHFRDRFGDAWTPAPLLEKLARKA